MSDTPNQITQISIDLKKYRIRIHKESLHLIGDPKYIQILVNINSRMVAIRAVESGKVDLQTFKVDQNCINSDFSYEIYSRHFITRLCNEFDCFKKSECYRLTGTAIESERMAVFTIDSLQKIDNIWGHL